MTTSQSYGLYNVTLPNAYTNVLFEYFYHMYLKRCDKNKTTTWVDTCYNHPLPALENLTTKKRTPLDKYLGTLRAYYANKFSYTTQVQYKEDIPWLSLIRSWTAMHCVKLEESQTHLDVRSCWEPTNKGRAQILTVVKYIIKSYSVYICKYLVPIWHFH